MVLSSEVTAQIKEVLEKHPEGLSITDLVKLVDINRNTAGRYLENLLLSGQVEMRRFGMAKMYTLAKRLPVSSVLSISSELVMQLVHNQRIIYANDRLLTFLGASAKDLFGKNIEFTQFAVVFEDVFPELLDRFRRGLKGEAWHGELSRPVQGRSFFCRVAPTVSNDGTKGVSVLLDDITDQKRDEVRIRESETRLRSIFTVSPFGIGMAANRIFLEVNLRFCQITGYSPAELVGKSARILYPSDEVFEEIGTTYMRQIRENGSSSVETQWVRKDGMVIDIFLSSIPLDPTNISGGITFTAMDITERKQAEKALRDSESTARALLNAPTDTIILLDNRGVILDLNDTAVLRLARKREDVVGILSDSVLPPDLAQERRRKISEVVRTRKPVRFTDENRGTWFDNVAYPILDYQGNVARLAIIARDITDQKRAEAALKESEEKYRHLVEKSLQGLTILQNGRPVYANSAMLEISGYTFEEYLAFSAEELMATVHPEDRHRIGTVKADRLAGKKTPRENEFRILRKDGKIRWVLTYGTLITFKGAPAIQIVYLDITGRKQAEQALRESEERYRRLAEASQDLIFVINRHDRVEYVNSFAAEALGLPVDKVIGQKRSVLFSGQQGDRQAKGLRHVFETGKAGRSEGAMEISRTLHWFDHFLTPIKDANGIVTSVLGVSRDITSRKQAEQALHESEDRNRKLVEILPDAVFLHQDGRIIYVNQAAVRILAASDEHELLGKNVLDFVQPEYRDAVRTNIIRDLHGEITPSMELRMSRVDGSPIVVEGRGVATTIDGKPAVLVVINDITDRFRAGR